MNNEILKKLDNKYITRLIVPLVFEQLLAVSVGMIDTLMVSTVGQEAVSSVALVDNINRLIINVIAAFCTGGVVIASQYFGNGSKENSRKSCAQLINIILIFTILTMLVFCFFTRPLLSAIFGNVDKEVMDGACTYIIVTSISFPFLGLYNAGAAIYRSMGNSKISMKISILLNIINIAFNAVFVFGFHWGVFGVGFATLISRVVASAIMHYNVMFVKNPLQLNSISLYRLNRKMIRRILNIGIPSGIENGMFQIGKIAVVSIIAKLGTDAIAANAVGYQIIDFPNIIGTSAGLALITIAGYTMGANDPQATRLYTRKMLKIAYISDWICKGLLFVFVPFVVSWFSLSAKASESAVLVIRCFSIASIVIWPLSFTLPSTLRAAGDVKYTMLVSIISMWLFRVISSYIFAIVFDMGILGAWIGMFIDWYARGILYGLRYLSHRWENIKVI